MKVIDCNNVNDALEQGIQLMIAEGLFMESRAGNTLEIPEPVATVYKRPDQRVLINRIRDANPFFHLMESLWILAGREDVKFLCEFNKRMSEYSDDGEVFNAPYGFRLRKRFQNYLGYSSDQLSKVISLLKDDPNTRQAICQIWDPIDLDKQTLDKACNMSIVFRIRNNKLDMTVYNRSNDVIWGAYGANAVQFSMIQEYVAAHLDIKMGTYTQVSNSYHVYLDGPGGKVWDRVSDMLPATKPPYSFVDRMVSLTHEDIYAFDIDLKSFFILYDDFGWDGVYGYMNWQSNYFIDLVIPMLSAYLTYKEKGVDEATKECIKSIQADDWRTAAIDWLLNRKKGAQ